MSERIKCLVLTKDADGKVSVVAEEGREDALAMANKMAIEGPPEGCQVEVFCPDRGGIFYDDGSMKAYNDAVEANKKAKSKAAAKATAEEKAARTAELEAELAELKGTKPKAADDAKARADAKGGKK